jgi:hypothetical protein
VRGEIRHVLAVDILAVNHVLGTRIMKVSASASAVRGHACQLRSKGTRVALPRG